MGGVPSAVTARFRIHALGICSVYDGECADFPGLIHAAKEMRHEDAEGLASNKYMLSHVAHDWATRDREHATFMLDDPRE